MRILILAVYNLLFPILFVLYLPLFVYKLFKRGHFRQGFSERFGLMAAPKRERLAALPRPVWIHAVSVGETVAAVSFIRRWSERQPDVHFVLSTTTATGQKIARDKAPANVTPIYCPIDFYPWVWLSLRRINPVALVIFEVEFWPNLILAANSRGIPVALANGRMSDRSARGYARWRFLFYPIMSAFRLLAMQSQADADRIRRVVGDDGPVHVCGTIKFDQVPDAKGGDVHELLDQVFPDPDRLILVAASTHPGEESIMAATVAALRETHPHLRLLLVPRHAERAAEVEPLVTQHGLTCRRLTVIRQEGGAPPPVDVLLADTTGEMMTFLAAADIVYMGKSLGGQEGGHNIIEPAIFGKPIIHGHHMENFRLVVQLFREADATVEVTDEATFLDAVRRLLDDPAERQRLAHASRTVVEQQRGATDRTLDLLGPFV